MELNVAAVNTPRKSFLLPPEQQARALARLYRKHSIAVSVQPETYTNLARAIRQKRRWGIVEGQPNTDLPNFKVGTSIVYDKIRYKLLAVTNIKFDFEAGRTDSLNCPVALFRNRVTGYIFVVIGVHVPTRSAASERFRDNMNKRIADYAEKLSVPVIIAGDFNNAFVAHYYTLEGFKKTHTERRGLVDGILVKGFKIVEAKEVTQGIHNIITDHHQMLVANLDTKSQDREDRIKVLPAP